MKIVCWLLLLVTFVNSNSKNLGFLGQHQTSKLEMGNNPEEKLELFSNRETLVYQCSNQTQWSGLNLDLRFILCDV